MNGVLLPCRKCMGCRIDRSSNWTTRLLNEASTSESAIFITLTYAVENPERSLRKKDVQDWLKRLRYSVGKSIRYYIVGEYGPGTERPHYHGILFNVDTKDFEFQYVTKNMKGNLVYVYKHDTWDGIITIDKVNHTTAQYCSKYITKMYIGQKNVDTKAYYFPREAPFQLFSKGLGRDYVDRNANKIKKEMGVFYMGKNRGMPDYYKRRLGIKLEDVGFDHKNMPVYKGSARDWANSVEKEMTPEEIRKEAYRLGEQREKNIIRDIELNDQEEL